MTGRLWGTKALPGLSNYQQLFHHGELGFQHIHAVHIALLQHSSLYESIASSLHKAQKKALGKTLVGRELCMSAHDQWMQAVANIQGELFQIIGERRQLRIGGHNEVACVSFPGWGRLQRKTSEVERSPMSLCHLIVRRRKVETVDELARAAKMKEVVGSIAVVATVFAGSK